MNPPTPAHREPKKTNASMAGDDGISGGEISLADGLSVAARQSTSSMKYFGSGLGGNSEIKEAKKQTLIPVEIGSKVRYIRPLPKRIAMTPAGSPTVAFEGENGLNQTTFSFAAPAPNALIPAVTSNKLSITGTRTVAGETFFDVIINGRAVTGRMIRPEDQHHDSLSTMATKKDENLVKMASGNFTSSSSEVPELEQKIQGPENELLVSGPTSKAAEKDIPVSSSLNSTNDCRPGLEKITYPSDESKGNISSSSQSSTVGYDQKPTESLPAIFTRTAGMEPEERKKELFESQGFTKEELCEDGDADLMANILEGFAIEYDEDKKTASQPAASPPLTRTAFRLQNRFEKQPAVPESTTPPNSVFSFKNIPSMICYLLGLCAALILIYKGQFLISSWMSVPNSVTAIYTETVVIVSRPVHHEPVSLRWSHGSFELSAMITCSRYDEPIVGSTSSPICQQEVVYKHDPLFPVQRSMWVGYQWTKVAWKRRLAGCHGELAYGSRN